MCHICFISYQYPGNKFKNDENRKCGSTVIFPNFSKFLLNGFTTQYVRLPLSFIHCQLFIIYQIFYYIITPRSVWKYWISESRRPCIHIHSYRSLFIDEYKLWFRKNSAIITSEYKRKRFHSNIWSAKMFAVYVTKIYLYLI